MSKLYSALYDEKDPFGEYEVDFAITPDHLDKVDGFLVLWGGQDISPSIYNQHPNRYTQADSVLSKRDRMEVALAKKAIKIGMPIVGICRGAQLMCALSGGKLVQHVNGHHGTHFLRTHDDRLISSNSIHHQMMLPFEVDHKMLAWSNVRHSDVYVGEYDRLLEDPPVEPEIVFFPKTKALCIQGHPEYLTPGHEFVQYCNSLIKEHLNV